MAISTTHDIVPDSPTNTFATLNPLDTGSSVTILDGNLIASASSNLTNFTIVRATTPFPKTGVYYFECRFVSSSNGGWFGIDNGYGRITGNQNGNNNGTAAIGNDGNGDFYLNCDASRIGSETFTSGLVIPVVWDANNKKIYTHHGNPSSTNLTDYNYSGTLSLVNGDFFPIVGPRYTLTDFYLNFGQDHTFSGTASGGGGYQDANGIGSFYYSPPTGALALCTANLPDPDIDPAVDDLPEDYMKAVAYDGSIGTDTLVDVGFPADLIWIKARTASYVTAHMVYDTIRGRTSVLQTNNTDSEYDYGNLAPTISTSSTPINGFKTPPSVNNNINDSANTYVAWCFRAGGVPTTDNTATSGAMNANGSTATSSNSSVSIDGVLQSNYTPAGLPTIYPKRMSVNTKAGFSIIRYSGNSTSGASIPTGLNSDVDFFIYKAINDGTYGWNSWHRSLTDDHYIALNTTSKEDNSIFVWDTSGMSNNVITHGSWLTGANVTGKDYIIYAWHSVPGYSAFGSYTGNGVADGPFVYTGFKPAWVMVKCSSNGLTNWFVEDSTRNPYNVVNSALFPDTSGQELGSSSTLQYDFLSNGFKVRGIQSAGLNNTSGYTYIFAAFAEMPFKYANAR